MSLLGSLRSSRSGVAAIEFALVAPVFLAGLFGLIEASRVFWIKQSLDEVAFNTARCMSVSSTCDTTANQKTFAVQRAADYGITIVASDVTLSNSTTCKGVAGSNTVVIVKTISSPLNGFVPSMPQSLSATACFPVLS